MFFCDNRTPVFTVDCIKVVLRGRPFNSWGGGGGGDFWSSRIFFLAIWWARYFFPFFSHKLSITFVLHEIFFFRQALAGNFFSKSPSLPGFRVVMAHWTALTAGRFRRCWEEKTTRSNRMKFRLPLPTAWTVYTPNAVRKLNKECFFLSLKRQVNSNPTACSYIRKDHEKRS